MSQPAYPALYDVASRVTHPLIGSPSFLVGRSETADVTVLDIACSRQQFRIVRDAGRYCVEPLSSNSLTYLNGKPISKRTPLDHKDQLAAGNTRFVFLARPLAPAADNADVPVARLAPPPSSATSADMTRMAAPGSVSIPPPPPAATAPVRIAGVMLIGRDASRAQIHLDHPHVSRTHARVFLDDTDRAILVDLASANGTFVNGRRILSPTILESGDQIDVGPFALVFDGEYLSQRTRSDNVELIARAVKRVVTDRQTGKPLTLLHDINLVIRPREFVCLLGPSGSGKSTLLAVLSGRTEPDGGDVLVNGRDLHANFEAMKQDLAVVPQKDVLHDSLGVGDALWYTARLRLPPDLRAAEVTEVIDDVLETVNLQQRRGTLIRHLSGGQVKRASLANEIMCKPTLLFLDEVTSGLDEQTDRDMMDLFRGVADTGKTVVCITHSLANVERTCHLVVILTAGGRLAFVGKPSEALTYFGITRLGDVYERLAERPAEEWEQAFRAAPLYERYVASRLPKGQAAEVVAAPVQPAKPLAQRAGLLLRQTVLLTRRYFAIWRGDYASLLAMFGQSVLVAVLLGLLFGDLREAMPHLWVNLLFLMAVTSFWFGCNNAAKEIVKERVIYERERDFNVRVVSYFCSKFLLLVLFSVAQVLVLTVVVLPWCGPPAAGVVVFGLLACLAVAGVSLGLLISAAAPTENMAITLIPVAVIPQILLAGVIAPVKGVSKFLAQSLCTVYWGDRALTALLPADDLKAVGIEQGWVGGGMLLVLMHAFVFVLAALVVLIWQGRRGKLVKLLRKGMALPDPKRGK